MSQLLIKETRPNVDINFFHYDQEINQYIQDNFVNTGKLISKKEMLSADTLIRFTTLNFVNESANDLFFNDAVLSFQFAAKEDYNKYYNIDYVHTHQTGLIPLVISPNIR